EARKHRPEFGEMIQTLARNWPVVLAGVGMVIMTTVSFYFITVYTPSFGKMVAVELWLSLLYAWYNGAMVVALTEVVPASVRTSGFSLAYSLATTLGGSSLLISTWLIAHTGDKAAPGYWMSFAAVCGLIATLALYRRPAGGLQYLAPGAAGR